MASHSTSVEKWVFTSRYTKPVLMSCVKNSCVPRDTTSSVTP